MFGGARVVPGISKHHGKERVAEPLGWWFAGGHGGWLGPSGESYGTG